MNPRRTWLTARRGDAVILRHNGTQAREHIDAIELYSVFPSHFNGSDVESARTWIDGATSK